MQDLFGAGRPIQDVTVLQMALRALVFYLATLLIVRVGTRRMIGKGSPFDLLVGIMLGSLMSRGINTSAPMVPTLVAGAVLIVLHWLIARLATQTDAIDRLAKGEARVLVRDGQVLPHELKRANLSREDLEAALRVHTGSTDPAGLRRVYFERDGAISVLE